MTTAAPTIKPLSSIAFLFALLSLAFTVIVVACLVGGALFLHHRQLHQLFTEAVQEKSLTTAFSFYPRLELATERIEKIAQHLFSQDSGTEKRAAVRRAIYERIVKSNIPNRNASAQAVAMLRELPTLDLSPDEVAGLNELRISRAELGEVEGALIDAQQEREARKAAIDRFIKQHAVIGDDFGELLGLRSTYHRSGTQELLAYTGGVLKDLPQLSGVPDNVSDLTALRSVLAEVGGHVDVEGENAAETFAVRLESMKTLSHSIVNDVTRSRERIRDVEFTITEETRARDRSMKIVQQKAAELLVSLSSPRISL